tara:strand:- start:20471 stop:20686 length:216 start_codon:yes stop_codon:yes gene_type:complete
VSELQSFRVFTRDAKGNTRAIEMKSGSAQKLVTYIENSQWELKNDIEDALGVYIKASSPLLIEIRGGQYGK